MQLNEYSDAGSGWPGWALALPEFGVLVKPIPTRGADYAHRITACPPRFENLAASLHDALVSNRIDSSNLNFVQPNTFHTVTI